MKKHILCIGDSNTHGLCTDPSESADHGSRYNEEERWTCLLQKALGAEYLVIEEGLSGRTCVYDDPDMDSVNLLPVLHALLNSHEPLDLLILMLGYTFVRKLHSYKVNGNLIIAFFSAFSCLLAVPYMIFNYTPMTTKQLLLLLGAGVAAACGQIGVTGAYFNAPASKISIYEYTQIIFSAILGFLAFGQIPDATSIIGYTIIIGSAAAVFFYNSHKQKTQAHLS